VSVAQAISAFYAVDFRPSTAEMSAVAQKFGNGRLVNWRALCAVVEPPPAPEKADSPENTKPEPAPEVVEFLRRVYQAVKRCGATLRSEFLKVDIRKSGILTAQVFKSVLDGLSIRSSASEIIVLLRPYFQGKTEMIEYPAFCEDLELFGKTPAPAPRTAPKSFDREENKEKSERALRLFKAALVSRRLNGEELFVAHDPARMGTVLTTTLRPATKSINALLSEETLQQIEKDFRDQRQPERFNYRRLCATLASVHPTEEDVAQVAEQRIQSCGEREGSEPIVVAIKGKLAERRKSIYDVFASVVDDFMPVTQFRNRVSAAGIYLSEAEVQKLTWKYKTGRKNEIDWRAFCDDVHESCPI
jgi:Ca2+-binding EF-hand superfamily protein